MSTLDPLADLVVELVRAAALAGQPCPTNEALSADTRCSTRAVRDALARAEAAGVVRVKRGVRARVVEDAAGAWRTRGDLIEVRPGVLSGTWTAARDAELRRLWASGESASRIGARMGLTKHAVVGRAHRLLLPPRPSPIGERVEQPPRIPRAPRSTLSPPAGLSPRSGRVAPSDPSGGSGHIQPAEDRGPLAAREPRVAPSVPRPASGRLLLAARPASSPYKTCQWIEGEPAGERTLFCGDPVTTRPDGGRSSYCAAHHARCWRPSLRQVSGLGRAA